jgi:hypothetical protein
MAFRLYDPSPVYFDSDGVTPCAAGTLETFEDEACTTPYATFNSPDLDVENAEVITLNASGRSPVEIWSGEPFWLRLKDEDGNVIWTREITSGQEAAQSIPSLAGNSGKFLTNDGTNMSWADLEQLPDPTGSAGQSVRVNGDASGYELYTPTEPDTPEAEYDIDLDANDYVQIGEYRRVWGTGTVAAAATLYKNTATVTFDTAFDTAPFEIVLTNTTPGGSSTYGKVATLAASSITTNGFTVTADVSEDDSQSQHKLANATTFMWAAAGKYTTD